MTITPLWVLLAFFILGWSYYMVATILMKGSLFISFRAHVEANVSRNMFYYKLNEMLGCLMCTATQTALWTLGLSTFVLGLSNHLPEMILSGVFGKPIELPFVSELILTAMISFALSVSVSGQAWVIHRYLESRANDIDALNETFQKRELELLAELHNCHNLGNAREQYEFDLTLDEE
jgi:hypothetical protein